MRKTLAWALLPLLLVGVGCATPYQPGGFMGGFSEMMIAPRTYEVTFEGNGWTSGPRAHQLALRRAAELTVQSGLHGFFVRDDRASVATSASTTPVNCTNIGVTTSCTGGDTQVVNKPQSDITITMVSAGEAAQMPQQVLVYDARLILSQVQ